MAERPRLIVGSRADLAVWDWEGERLSAVTGDGIRALVGRLATMVATSRQATASLAPAQTFVVHRPEPEGVLVERAADGGFVVRGRPAERAVALSDLTNAEALAFAQHRLKRLGVDRALARAGARDGDLVHIGTFTFEYEAD